ncbi:hypothetical protein P22_1532 [Propionispora sp. 2/2-37]|uniref:HipA family kinase n=1 Tax=Propionispora sp. 2/2-37 TaxID=1677858 RepID=UPI0006BB6E22|nr:HipA family kinase [Propionispora sp. 2/2-37]CUH95461.1 hypothetical protein P22_1532 [Propionispora sp. 2/2-37]
MLSAVKYLGPVGMGVTSPQLFLADDHCVYIVKLQNNRLGPKILANELLAAQIGKSLALTFPPSDIIFLDEKIIKENRRLWRTRVPVGIHFASKYIKQNRYVSRTNLAKAGNISDMAGVVLFDHLFHNFDRTGNHKNLLLCQEQEHFRIYAIDNSHLFGKGRWDSRLLVRLMDRIVINKQRTYGTLLKYFLKPEHFSKYVKSMRTLDDGYWNDLVGSIPEEWLPLPSEREVLLRFLLRRRDMVDKIAERIFSLIPDKNRSADMNQSI